MTYIDELYEAILTAQEEMLKHKIEANSVTLNGRKYGKLIENCPPNMKPTIFGMAVKTDYALPDDYDFLLQYEPPQPKTNEDGDNEITVKLDSPITEEQWDTITDVDFDHTERIYFNTKHGKTVEFVKVVRCKECARKKQCRTSNTWAVPPGDNWFCADGVKGG